MQWSLATVWIWALGAAMTPVAAVAQGSAATTSLPTSAEDVLHSLSDRAGVVFVGSVASIRRIASDGVSSGVVEVTFQVEQAVRGTAAGSSYTVREWAGLWMANDQRYHVGQRLLMLLNTPGAGGLSSPVGGLDGAIPVHGTVAAADPAGRAAAPAAVADLSWLATHAVRPVVYAPTAVLSVHGAPLRGVGARVEGGSHTGSTPAEAAPAAAAAVPQTLPVSTVVGLLASWSDSHAR